MKILSNVVTVVKDGKVTITADIADKSFQWPVQQTTVTHIAAENVRFPRHVQLSHEAVFVKNGPIGFAIEREDLVNIAKEVEPQTSYRPVVSKSDGPFSAKFVSELPLTYKWQNSAAGKVFVNIEGQTNQTLDLTKVVKGEFVRCVATNAAGSTATAPVQVT
jgi:hypothetical protein